MMRRKKDNEGPTRSTGNEVQEEDDSNAGVERIHSALKYRLNEADNETCRQPSRETVAFQVPRETCDSREDFASDAVILAGRSSDDDCSSNDGILATNDESSDTESQCQYKTVVITVTTIEPVRSSRHKMTKRQTKETTATMKIQRRADASDEDIYFRIDGENNIIANVVEGSPEERSPRREESQIFPVRHPSLDEALEQMRELEEVYEEAEFHRDEHSAHESNEMDVFYDCNYDSDGNDVLFMDTYEDEDDTRIQMLDAGSSEAEACDGEFEGTYDETSDEARCNMDASSSYEEIIGDLSDDGEENDSWERRDAQTLETFFEQEKSVDCLVDEEMTRNVRASSVERESQDQRQRMRKRSREEGCDEEEKSRDEKRACGETKHNENERSRSVEESCGKKKLDDVKTLEKAARAKTFERAPKNREHNVEKQQDSQQKNNANQISEDPRSTRTDEKLTNSHPLNEVASAKTLKHASTSHEHNVEKRQDSQQKTNANQVSEDPRSTRTDEKLANAHPLNEVTTVKTLKHASKSHQHDVEEQQDSQQKNNANQVSEDPGSTRTDEKLANGHPLIEATSAKTFEHIPKNDEHDIEKKQDSQQEKNVEGSLKNLKTPEIAETIEKSSYASRDPRLMSNRRRIALISQAKQVKQGVTIVDPPFLPQGDQRAASSNVVSVNKSSPVEQSTRDANPSPAQIRPAEFYGSPSTPQTHSFPKKFSENKLARNKRREQNTLARDKWRRLVHSSANFVPTSRQSTCNFTPEKLQRIKSERKEKLRKLAEQAKYPRMEGYSPNATAICVPEVSAMTKSTIRYDRAEIATTIEESTGKCDVAPSTDVTNETRACFPSSEQLEQSSLAEQKSGMFEQTSRGKTHERGKENADTSNVEGDAIKNNLVNEGGDVKSAIDNSLTAEWPSSSDLQMVAEFDNWESKEIFIEESESSPRKRRPAAATATAAAAVGDFELSYPIKRSIIPLTHEPTVINGYLYPVGINKVMMELISRILRWNPDWLKQKRNHEPPVVDETKLVKMLPKYQTYEEYCTIIQPLMTLELWHGILKDDGDKEKTPKSYQDPILLCEKEEDLRRWKILGPETYGHPVVGDLVFFNYVPHYKGPRDLGITYRTVFAYVTNVVKTEFSNWCPTPARKLPANSLIYTVLTSDAIRAKSDSAISLKTATYLRSDMRTILALHRLETSQLMNIILHPRIEDYRLPDVTKLDSYSLVTKDSLNSKQLEAVARVTKVVVQELPKICLIAGPPGTGKSKVIVNLIMQLLRGEKRCFCPSRIRILLCAPSNAAVDEVVQRLVKLNRSLEKKYQFRVVRAGRAETMNRLVSEVSLRELAKQELEKTAIPGVWVNESSREYIAKLCRMEEELLTEVDVIACTLTSCYTDQMELALSGSLARINVCIVDEATQCIEPETLIPLMLGIETLVLVGDTKQLPATVLSQKAKKLGLDRSLFARISQAFEHEPDSPIIQLNTQYRMSNPVALFPNKHFYSGILINAAIMHKLPLYFYRVFNLNGTQNKDKFSNNDEAAFVANLMYALIARANYDGAKLPVTVGIITPYNNQKKLLRKNIEQRIERLNVQGKINYDVNTVDSFQGQERDIIIMSCVRSHGIGFLSDRQRLCVALTRAKHSLILCGNFKTFEKDPTWKALLDDANKRGVYINVNALSNTERIKSLIIR